MQNGARLPQNGDGGNSIFSSMQNLQSVTKPPTFNEESQQAQKQPPPGSQSITQQQGTFGGEAADSAGAITIQEPRTVSQMSELDRFGLAGLFAMLRNDNSDVAALAAGQDLTTLGLDLNSPE